MFQTTKSSSCKTFSITYVPYDNEHINILYHVASKYMINLLYT